MRAAGDTPSTIDRFIPEPDVAKRHATTVRAPSELVFDTAEHYDLLSHPFVSLLIHMRERMLGASGMPERAPMGLIEEMTKIGWGVLSRTPGREIVMGAVTKPWVGDVVFRSVPPDLYAAFAEPDFVKIAWTLEAEPIDPERARFITQTRVVATDETARAKFRKYWSQFGTGIELIRWVALPAVKRAAEKRWRAGR